MRKAYIFLFALITLFILAGCGQSQVNNTSAPQSQTDHSRTPQNITALRQGTVTRVVDGDTIEVALNGKKETIRLIGVDTPETVKPNHPVEPYGKEASDFTKSRLGGKAVFIETDVQERDRYGRLLSYVWIEPPAEETDQEIRKKMFNAMLLLDGYAQILTVPPNVKYVDYFTTYQKEAREVNKGLWGISAGQAKPDSKPKSYTGNANSKKLHYSDCKGALEISPSNRVSFAGREEAIKAGYEPCRTCKP